MNNQSIKKAPQAGAAILTLVSSVLIIALLTTVISYFFCENLTVALIIAVFVIPSICIVWLMSSMTAYIIGKYKNRISHWIDLNLRVSSLAMAALLFVAILAIFICGIVLGIDLISTLYGILSV